MKPKSISCTAPIKLGIDINKNNNKYGLGRAVKDVSEMLSSGVIYAPSAASKCMIGLDKAAQVSSFVAKNSGRVAIGAAVAYGAYETYNAYKEGGTSAAVKKGTRVAGGIAGGYCGAKIGAAISAKPALAVTAVAGPIAGGAVLCIGTTIGAVAGYCLGEEAVGFWQDVNEPVK